MNVWKKTLFTGMLCVFAAGTIFVAGCKEEIEGNEQNHPVFIQAKADRDAGKYKEAADGLISLLEQAPRSAFLHKELAGLYQDNLCEYHLAIYHYERYLRLAQSLSSDDERAFRDLITKCRKDAAKQAIAEDPTLAGGVGAVADNSAEITKLRVELDRYKRFRELYHEQDEKVKQLEAELNSKKTPAAPAPAAPAAEKKEQPAPAPAAPAAAEEVSGEFDEYVVQSGDSLSKIARKTYGSAAKRYLDMIRTANNLKGDNIRLGQKLKLPKLK